jgi:beta-ribofuranosylaminobenzene 5'-phosphate synthase
MICEIKAFGRLHAGLIDLSGDGYRVNGGIGWAINGDYILIRAARARMVEVVDHRDEPLEPAELADVAAMLQRFIEARLMTGGVRIDLSGDLPSHRGFGVGTALRLAALEATAAIYEDQLAKTDLIAFSGRGGTSGVGIRTYFEGGLVVDIGHRRSAAPAPSRDRATAGTPLPLLRVDMPQWTFGICTAASLQPVPISVERAVFQKSLPLPRHDVEAALYDVVFGMVAAVMEDDQTVFADAVDALQSRGWKRAEWAIHGVGLISLSEKIRAKGGLGIGLSSMGPTLYFLGRLAKLGDDDLRGVRFASARNEGRQLRVVVDG